MSRTDSPPRRRFFRKRRICSITIAGSAFNLAPTGAKTATGAPCRVIVMLSPLALGWLMKGWGMGAGIGLCLLAGREAGKEDLQREALR